ncbi:uncharacterized protein LOC122011684 [Zingiber officinale]|uniref:Uncharacterized protein n=1 Tax=Zingiber officinale TaxID=94328 RepID=A0A8J5FMD6_ZINOF|nr:uncharacterized protein LOC122011684 [Zingiber officinale]KAG6487198.1 hypothetical protein ZIOFF_055781 [Zingiber officinale]
MAGRNKQHDHGSEPPGPPHPVDAPRRRRRTWLSVFPLLYLSASAAVYGYRERGEPWSLAFVLFSYSDLLALFYCLGRFERAAEGEGTTEQRRRLKAVIWALAAALMAGFSFRVSAVLPAALGALIWVMAASVTVGGFCGLFLFDRRDNEKQ